MTVYKVTVTLQYPAWNEKDGITFVVRAASKSAAIKEARRINRDGGQVCSEHGRTTWTATESDDQTAATSEEDEARWRREDEEARRGSW